MNDVFKHTQCIVSASSVALLSQELKKEDSQDQWRSKILNLDYNKPGKRLRKRWFFHAGYSGTYLYTKYLFPC